MFEKHFVNEPNHLVTEALSSLTRLNPNLYVDTTKKVVRNDAHRRGETVAIISGGGAGHEPSFSGLVGNGMLTSAVTGSVFASPSAKQVLAAIEAQASPKGTLVTVMNYTGDVLNFGVAIEKAKARNPETPFEMLVVGEDVGVPRSRFGRVGRRGMAGTVLVHKITGALSQAGYSLPDIARIGRLVNSNMATVGASLDHVHIPGKEVGGGTSEFDLRDDELEIGMGIHNEPGCARVSREEYDLGKLVRTLLGQLLDPDDQERGFLKINNGDVVLLINNLGSTSPLELAAVVTEVANQLESEFHFRLVRVLCGTLMTSLNGPGFSITLLNVFETELKDGLLALLDAPCGVSCWPRISTKVRLNSETNGETQTQNGPVQQSSEDDLLVHTDADTMKSVIACLDAGLEAVIAAEPEVTKFDEIVGDGDCGTTLKRGAEAIRASLKQPQRDVVRLVTTALSAVEGSMDGTSGALFTIFLSALLQHLKRCPPMSTQCLEPAYWSGALDFAIESLSRYTVAQEGDRTLLDALLPFSSELRASKDCKQAAGAAQRGAEATKSMKASLGRTVYVGGAEQWLGVIPDPGAWGLAAFFSGLVG